MNTKLDNWTIDIVVTGILMAIMLWGLSGCTTTRAVASPSTSESTARIKVAQTQNEAIQGNLDRAERKNVLTKRWMELHHGDQ